MIVDAIGRNWEVKGGVQSGTHSVWGTARYTQMDESNRPLGAGGKPGALEKYLDAGLRVAYRGTIVGRNGLGERSSKLRVFIPLENWLLDLCPCSRLSACVIQADLHPGLSFPQYQRTSRSLTRLVPLCSKALSARLQTIPLFFP